MFNNLYDEQPLREIKDMFERLPHALVINIASQKGGVGKTTLSYLLGLFASDLVKINTLMLDQDSSRNLTGRLVEKSEAAKHKSVVDLYGDDAASVEPIKVNDNLSLIPGASDHSSIANSASFSMPFRLRVGLQSLKDKYDLIIIDNHNDLLKMTQAGMIAADFMLAPLEASDYGVEGVTQLTTLVKEIQGTANPGLVNLGFLPNEVDLQSNDQADYLKTMREKIPHFLVANGDLIIRKNVKIREAQNEKEAIWRFTRGRDRAKVGAKNVIEVLSYLLRSMAEAHVPAESITTTTEAETTV